MREIKFRGKKDNDRYSCLDSHYRPYSDFIYGDLLNIGDGQFKIKHQGDNRDKGVYVIPETVGQYTGLNDNNGKEIYEGDIVDNGHTVVYSSSAHQFRYIGIVKFDVKQGCLVIHNTDGNTKRITAKTVQTNKIKVLGNIYDNPGLLEGQ